jgi:hypothetical protein
MVGLVALVFTSGCSNLSKMDVETKMVTTRTVGTNVVESTVVTHRDLSKVRGAPWGGNILRFNAEFGGDGTYQGRRRSDEGLFWTPNPRYGFHR